MKFRIAASAAAVLFVVSAPASAQVAGFSDVPANHWAAASVAKLAEAGILTGYPAQGGKPAPKPAISANKSGYNGNKPITRYELAAVLYRFVTYIERADRQKKSKMGVQAMPAVPPATGKTAMLLLVKNGYVPAKSAFATGNGAKVVTADELSLVLSEVITKSREKTTPVSPDSLNGIEQPGGSHSHP